MYFISISFAPLEQLGGANEEAEPINREQGHNKGDM
jgi:hypothetical protein